MSTHNITIDGKPLTVTMEIVTPAPITASVREQWKKDDLMRAYKTEDEEEALEKFIAMYGDIPCLKNGRETARELMYSYARSFC